LITQIANIKFDVIQEFMKSSLPIVLFMAQLPPPVHGAALRNLSLMESPLINKYFLIYPLPLKFVTEMKQIRQFSLKKVGLTVIYSFRLLRVLLTRKINLAYFTMSSFGFAFYRDIIFITILKIFRKKILIHFRIKGIKKTSESDFGRFLIKYAFRGTDIVCLSNHHVNDVRPFINRAPYIVANGIKIEPLYDELTKKYDYKNDIPVILFLSNLTVSKGIHDLMEAIQILKKRNRVFRNYIVGEEVDLSFDDLKKLAVDLRIEDCIEILGPRYGIEKLECFAKADIFVFPTYFELFPGVLLEAMQFGKAIVTTYEGSIPEIIDDGINGILVNQRDPGSLADAIDCLLQDPVRRTNMGIAARDKFFSEYTLEHFENRMKHVFEDVLKKYVQINA
jgi:glycosyltransferase involved in cell wall biosynthesis